MNEHFPKPKSFKANVNVELDLSNCATKADLKNATRVDKSDFTKKTDLASLKSDVDKLDIDKLKNVASNLSKLKEDKLDIGKLETTPVDLSKPGDAVKNDAVKKTEYDELVKNVKAIQTTDTSNLVQTKLTITQKLMKLKKKLLIMIIVISILLHKNLII